MSGRDFTVRSASPADAETICDVLVRSIRDVCGPDYGDDPELLDAWCANKKPGIVRGWIADPDNRFLVACDATGRIVGAGVIHATGEIRLCYVRPEVLGGGAGHALLARLEEIAGELGLTRIVLNSTSTARGFYERHGFTPVAPPEPYGPGLRYPMAKILGG